MGSEGSESVKYCVQDRCQGNEPRVLYVRVQCYLLRVIPEVTLCSVFIINNVNC